MINRLIILVPGLLLISVFFTGCTSPEPADNLSVPQGMQFPSQPERGMVTLVETTVPPPLIIKDNETSKKWGSSALAQNATVYHQIDRNASYELSLGDITVRQNETPGAESSSLITINMTAKNSGTVPISVTFMADTFRDDAGDGCQYEYLHWCGVVAWYQINPGDSDTRTLTMPVSSAKGYDYLSSQKFLLGGIIDANTDTYGGTNTKSWLIDLKKSTNHGM